QKAETLAQVEQQHHGEPEVKIEELPPAGATQLQMLIQGMTCASCVASVEKALTQVQGVEKAQVNLAEQSALVFVDNDSDDLHAEILESVKQAGYQGEILQDAATQQEKQAQQQRQQQKRFKLDAIAGLVVGAPLMIWGVAGGNMMIRNTNDQLAWGAIGIVCLLLLATAGKHFFSNAWLAATHKRATMDTLVALGTGAAWFYSMLVVIFPDWFPMASRHVYFEASAMIIGLISLGHYIEAKAKANTTRSLQALINLQPQQATVITEQGDQQITVEQITLGMKLRIKPGEKVPVDGVVIQGESYIDESMLTGEPVPVLKAQEAQVSAGTLNTDGALIIEATGIGANTMLARIIRMVRTAQSSKPAIAKLADQISSVFVPVVVGIAILAAIVWFAVGPEPKASYMLVVTTTVLIIACPCALGLATPLSVTVGVGKAAELGILIKDADALQLASKVDTVVFDKTGTL
ncbi:HAD-IC family P-type ATPase, partial [Vibrio parahaemolyticus]|nr:HAD-IC family P-type ATPase [Vibrio parahaemolyticus]